MTTPTLNNLKTPFTNNSTKADTNSLPIATPRDYTLNNISPLNNEKVINKDEINK